MSALPPPVSTGSGSKGLISIPDLAERGYPWRSISIYSVDIDGSIRDSGFGRRLRDAG